MSESCKLADNLFWFKQPEICSMPLFLKKVKNNIMICLLIQLLCVFYFNLTLALHVEERNVFKLFNAFRKS